MRVTASNIVRAILGLPKDCWFNYIHDGTTSKVRVLSTKGPEGPIIIERRTNKKQGSVIDTKTISISTTMIWRLANAFLPNVPINVDRVLGASYSSRSVLETLLAHTPEFYWCIPGRIELLNDSSEIKRGHKHIMWVPDNPHKNGVLVESKLGSELAVSEIPAQIITYDSLAIARESLASEIDLEVKRRHVLIQIRLIQIGAQLGFRTWIAQNDKGFKYGDKRIGELEGVIARLTDERVLASYEEARAAANLIDCIWFKNGRLMPAVMEVEHSTGVTSGLTRMKKFQDLGPQLAGIRWVIVAADEDRDEVIRKANITQFKSLNAKFFSYSAVEELAALCKRRNLSNRSVNEDFLDCFMEPCLQVY